MQLPYIFFSPSRFTFLIFNYGYAWPGKGIRAPGAGVMGRAGSFYVNLTRAVVIWEEGTSIEGTQPLE